MAGVHSPALQGIMGQLTTWRGDTKEKSPSLDISETRMGKKRLEGVPCEDLGASLRLLDPGLDILVTGHNIKVSGNAVVQDASHSHAKLGADK